MAQLFDNMKMSNEVQQLSNWVRSILPDVTDFRTDFDNGIDLICLLQEFRPHRKPSQRYTLCPSNANERRNTRLVALAFAKELGVKGDFNEEALLSEAPDLNERIHLLKAIRRDLGPTANRSLIEDFDVLWFDEIQFRETTKYTLKIDFHPLQLRYNLLPPDDPESPVDSQVIDSRPFVDQFGQIFVISDGMSPPSDSIRLPSFECLFGCKFGEPDIASVIARYPLPIVEDPETHQCAVKMGDQLITPERVLTALFAFVRKEVEEFADQEVIDTLIGVPLFFTNTQHISVRTAAEKAGLHVLHIVVGKLLTDQRQMVNLRSLKRESGSDQTVEDAFRPEGLENYEQFEEGMVNESVEWENQLRLSFMGQPVII
jgi:hypothetical protein